MLHARSASEPDWAPLLSGDARRQALAAVEVIAEDVLEITTIGGAGRQWSLGGGCAGRAVLFSYVAEVSGKQRFSDAADQQLEAAIGAITRVPMGFNLYDGLLGVGWTHAHLGPRFYDHDVEEPSDIDEALLDFLRAGTVDGSFDLVSGLVGMGVYCLEALPRSKAREALEVIVDLLLASARASAQGLTWFTPPEQLPQWQLDLTPTGHYNF